MPIDADELALFVTHVAKFGRQECFGAATFDGFADELFVFPATVDVGGVEEIDPEFECPMDRCDGLSFVGAAVEFRHSHAAQPDGGDLWAIYPKLSWFHWN